MILRGGGGDIIASKTSAKAVAGDIYLYNKLTSKKIIVSLEDFQNIVNYDNFSPIGVVVIPGSHKVYGTNKCAVMSIVLMSAITPEQGTSSLEYIKVGSPSETGTRFEKVVTVKNRSSEICEVGGTAGGNTYIPNDTIKKDMYSTKCGHDLNATYYSIISSQNYGISPYLTDGSRNACYYQTSYPSSYSNSLSDFDGLSNTQAWYESEVDQPNWKKDATLEEARFAAACASYRYSPDGTKKGNWYIPSMGELGYAASRAGTINTSIEALISTYGVGRTLESKWCATSTANLYSNLWTIEMFFGEISNLSTSAWGYVIARAFLRV